MVSLVVWDNQVRAGAAVVVAIEIMLMLTCHPKRTHGAAPEAQGGWEDAEALQDKAGRAVDLRSVC